MDNEFMKYARITISEDKMSAILYLSSTPGDDGLSHTELFTQENIAKALTESGIKAGIDTALLQSVAINGLYDRYHVIAKGTLPVNGTDGYFTYHFKTELDNKPKILADGTVDYHNIDIYEPVNAGDEIVSYTPATAGRYGFNILGNVLPPVPGKDLQPIQGSGFTVSEDHNHYFSDCNGKVEILNGQLIVSNVLDIKGTVDITTGDIIFNGDVIIHGDVLSGSKIRVRGSLTIMGNVEAAYLSADGEIQLRAGMQGGGKGVVECNSDVWGKFFENTRLKVKKDIHANSMMNCDTVCEGSVLVSGRHGIIVGGNTVCQGNIEATVLGNMAEVQTHLTAGVNQHALSELNELEQAIKENTDMYQKHSQILEKLEAITNPSDSEKYNTMKSQITLSMEELNNRLETLRNELNQKLFLISTYSNSKIIVTKYLYPNVIVNLNGLHFICRDTYSHVAITDVGGEVHIVSQ